MNEAIPDQHGFHHEALFYQGDDDLVARLGPPIGEALEAGQAVLVAVAAPQIGALRDALGAAAGAVRWVDMAALGRNPARIIPMFRAFVARHRGPGRGQARVPLLGVGRPIYAERTAAEMVEAQRHEGLLNQAFARTSDFTLLCPYDTHGLGRQAIEEAVRTHPHLDDGQGTSPNPTWSGEGTSPFAGPLPEPAAVPVELEFDADDAILRQGGALAAGGPGWTELRRRDDLTLAVQAIASGFCPDGGAMRVWEEEGEVIVEVTGASVVEDALAGREWPAPRAGAGRGLWLANQLCDLVQVRRRPRGSVVRLHMRLD